MVNAHYQTSPNDLVQLLNDSNTQVFCALQEGKVAGAAVVLSEGGQEEGLAEAVCAGKGVSVVTFLPNLLLAIQDAVHLL